MGAIHAHGLSQGTGQRCAHAASRPRKAHVTRAASARPRHIVMAGLVPGIHVFLCCVEKEDVDGRDISAFTRVFDALCAGMTEQEAMPSVRPTHRRGNSFHNSLVKQPDRHSDTSPGLVRAPGSTRSLSSFPPPPMRGGGAPRAPCPWLPMGGPGVTGRPRARGLTHPCADVSATPWRATRHRSAFAFTAAGPNRGLTPAGLPGGRPLYVAWR